VTHSSRPTIIKVEIARLRICVNRTSLSAEKHYLNR
jgi:hypothetical protein